MDADLILFALVGAIEGSKIDVGRGVVNAGILETGPEDAEDRGEVVSLIQ